MRHALLPALALGLSVLALPVLAPPVHAQDMDDTIAAAQNQLGLLEFCEAQGHIDASAAATQRKLLEMMPAATDSAKVEAAYIKGTAGTLSVMGAEQNLLDAAAAQQSDLATLCGQMAAALASAMEQGGG